jgi:transcriptional regulator with XRE-family HTH domain
MPGMDTAIFLKEVGSNLRVARKEAGLRQVEVETKSGVAYRHYQDIEAGKVNVSLDTLCRLANAFNTTVANLCRGSC